MTKKNRDFKTPDEGAYPPNGDAVDLPEPLDMTDEILGLTAEEVEVGDIADDEVAAAAANEPPEEPEPTPEPEAAEPEVEAAAEEEEPEKSTEPELTDAEKHERGLRKTITELRQKNQALRAQQQAPAPVAAPAAPAMPSEPDIIKVSYEGDDAGISRETLREEIRRETAPDPQQVAASRFMAARDQWVNQDRPRNEAAAQRVSQAADLLNLGMEEYIGRTGLQPRNFDELVNTIEHSEAGETFRTHFPEITDIGEFVHAVMTPLQPGLEDAQSRTLIGYMKNYVTAQSWRESAASGKTSITDTLEQVEPASEVVQLPTKPRSMAQKGRGTQKATTDAQRYDVIMDKLAVDQFSPEAADLEREAIALERKLGLENRV